MVYPHRPILTDAPRRLPAALLGMMLAAVCIIVAGCTVGPDGRLLGADAMDAMIGGPRGHRQCNNCRSEYAAGCRSCGTSAWHEDGCTDCSDDTDILDDGVEFIPPTYYDPAYDQFNDGTFGSACDDGQCAPAVDEPPDRLTLRRFYEPEAGIFNFFVPPAAIGAPAPPPPGRFHPVPTRRVFSPRPLPVFGLPPNA